MQEDDLVSVHDRSIEEERDPFCIDQFEPGDPDNPMNWSNAKRWYLTMIGALLLLNATFASSSPTGVIPRLREHFNLSDKAAILTVSLFVCGYCVGPILWGPLSEQYGRRPVFVYPFFVYAMFQVAEALAQNTASLLIFRFLGGTFAAAPLTNSGALIADIWDAEMRGKAMAIFAIAPFAGPALGPIVAGFIADYVSWRWLFWILAIFAFVCEILIVFTVPETYKPILLARKAEKKRNETGDNRYYAPIERESMTFTQRAEHVLIKPFVILFKELMLIAMTAYMSFVYGCLYLLFTAYPIIFTQGHGFSLGVTGLMFLPIPIGGAIAVVVYIYMYNPEYEREAKRLAPKPVPPEFRLDVALWAGLQFSAAFFWFAWSSYPHVNYWVPLLSGLLNGYAIQLVFLGHLNYIVDAYLSVAASALASLTVVRSLVGAAFPLFSADLYTALSPQWAGSLLGFIALLMAPIPFIFKKYGPVLRKHSKYCPCDADEQPSPPRSINEKSESKSQSQDRVQPV